MRYFILLLMIPFVIFAENKENTEESIKKDLLKKEKKIDVVNPVDVKKLDKEVKNEEDAKNAANKGAGEKDGSKVTDPHNFKDVKDNKIDTQKISDENKTQEEEIDPSKFMTGLGDTKNDENKDKDDKKVIITPNSNRNPFNDKIIVQDIATVNLIAVGIGISGDMGVRINLKDDDDNSGDTLFQNQIKFNLSFEKKLSESSFKITLGTKNNLRDDWATISTIEAAGTSIFLKEAYYTIEKLTNIKIGRFFSSFNNDYFFSKSLSFDGLEFFSSHKDEFSYKLLVSFLQNENIFTDTTNIATLTTVLLGFNKKNFNISLYYSWLYGKDLDALFSGLTNGDTYSRNNHYLAGNLSYFLDLKDSKLKFSLNGSFNFTAENKKFGSSFDIDFENKSLLSKLTLLYKERNSVISPLSLQESWFTNDIMGGSFKFAYKYNQEMNLGVEFSAGKSISDKDKDLNYVARAVYNITF